MVSVTEIIRDHIKIRFNKIHILKSVDPYFTSVWENLKTFEFRVHDRDFNKDDLLIQYKYPENDRYIIASVPYILTNLDSNYILCQHGGELKDFCIMSLTIEMRVWQPLDILDENKLNDIFT